MARKQSKIEKITANAAHIANQLSLTANMAIIEKSNIILESANKIQGTICKMADSIKIDAYEQVKNELGELIPFTKPLFFELVNMRKVALFGDKPIDVDETMHKIESGNEWINKHDTLRKYMHEHATDGKAIKLLTNESQIDTSELSTDFIEVPETITTVIEQCAIARHELDTEVWPQLHMHRDCFCIECDASPWEFDDLLKYHYYRSGGYPSPNSPPKLWHIIGTFKYAYDLCNKFELDFINEYCKRFGLEIKSTASLPNVNDWDI
jgi:hypothetical protein